MPKLASQLNLELTPEQIAQTREIFEKLTERGGGMILGSLCRIGEDGQEKVLVGFRLIEVETAERLIEIANANGE